jgi:hypothetical protein
VTISLLKNNGKRVLMAGKHCTRPVWAFTTLGIKTKGIIHIFQPELLFMMRVCALLGQLVENSDFPSVHQALPGFARACLGSACQ